MPMRDEAEIDQALETLEEVIAMGRALKLSLDLLVELAVAKQVLRWVKAEEDATHFETLLAELVAYTHRARRRQKARLN